MTGPGTLLPFICKSRLRFQKARCNTSTSAEDAAGPTATCQITTYEPEPQLELPFEIEAV